MAVFHVRVDLDDESEERGFDVEADMMTSNDHWAFFYDGRKQLVALVPRDRVIAIVRQDAVRSA
jgi:hypothetical protein